MSDHEHDARYYEKSSMDDKFYTREEVNDRINGLLTTLIEDGVIIMEHTHDDDYYTKGEIEALLDGIINTIQDMVSPISSFLLGPLLVNNIVSDEVLRTEVLNLQSFTNFVVEADVSDVTGTVLHWELYDPQSDLLLFAWEKDLTGYTPGTIIKFHSYANFEGCTLETIASRLWVTPETSEVTLNNLNMQVTPTRENTHINYTLVTDIIPNGSTGETGGTGGSA
jgi:hypothetical protein